MQTLAQSVIEYIRRHELLKAGDRVGIAVSGGVDSVALLRLMLELRQELGIVLSVVHFNHQLRGAESNGDENFVAALARHHKLEFHCGSGDVRSYAAEKHLSLEAAARALRYNYFRRLLKDGTLTRIATAHTLDDQAETVLLRVVRGAGTRGLAGIYPKLSVSVRQEQGNNSSSSNSAPQKKAPAFIVRPLLATRRKELETYLASLKQDWREDSSNRDLRHARNRVRHGILPRLERNLNPEVREALAETAEIARAEEDYWTGEVARILPSLWKNQTTQGTLNRAALAGLPLALQRRVVRAASESLGLRLEFRHVEEILEISSGRKSAPKLVVLPADWQVTRNREQLQFTILSGNLEKKVPDYEYVLPIPGRVKISETGTCFEAILVSATDEHRYNCSYLFDRARLGKELRVRNWRAGDRFWPAHTKSPKKLKELLQKLRVTGAERKFWPVIASESEIVWVRRLSQPQHLRLSSGTSEAVLIRETLHSGM